jgi:hypothetical protein
MTGWSRVLLLLLVAMMATAIPARAQETPAPPNSASARFLPDAADFGDGWSLSRTAALEVDTDVFREGAVGSFVGPDGSRVVAAAMLVTQDRVAVRRSWEAAMSFYDNYSGELEHLSGRDDELDSEPSPPGCVEAKRIDGTARQLGIDTGITMGVTLCAAEPDLIFLAVASGSALGLSGFAASDAIASLMATTAEGATRSS